MPEPVCDQARVEGEGGFLRLDREGRIAVKPLHGPAYEHTYDIPAAGYRGGSVAGALQHFARCLADGAPFETEGEEYLRQVMGAAFAGYRSAGGQRSIRLENSEEEAAWQF